MEKIVEFRVSRWKAIPFFLFGIVLLLFAYGMLAVSQQFETAYNSMLARIFFVLFGLLLLFCSVCIVFISGIRLLKKPLVLLLDSEGVHYYYSTFHNKKKNNPYSLG